MNTTLKRRSALMRTLLGIFLTFILALIVCIGALPTWISSESGKNWTLTYLNNRISGTVSLDQLSINWWGGQSFKGFILKDEQGADVVSIQSFESKNTFFSLGFGLLTNRFHFNSTSVVSPHLKLIENSEGELNLEKALRSKKKKEKISKPPKESSLPKVSGDLHITDGEIYLFTPQIEPTFLSNLTIDLKKSPALFHISGKTKQGSQEGELEASGNFEEPLHFTAHIQDFPLALLDQLSGNSLFTEGLGRSLTLDFELSKQNRDLLLSITFQTANLQGSFKGTTHQNRFVLSPGGELVFTFTPSFFKTLIQQSASKEWMLGTKSDLRISIHQLEIPINEPFSFKNVLLSGKASLERAEILNDKIGHFSLNNLAAELKTDKNLLATYRGSMQSKTGTSQLEGNIEIDSSGKILYGAIWNAFPVDLLQLIFQEAEVVSSAVGPTMDITAIGTYDHQQVESTISLLSPQLTLQGTVEGENLSDLDIHLTGKVTYPPRKEQLLGPHPDIEITAKGAYQNKTFALPSFNATLKNPFWTLNVRGQLGEKGKPFQWENVELVAIGTIKDLPIQTADLVVKDGRFYVQVDGSANKVHSEAILNTQLNGETSTHLLETTIEAAHFIKEGNLDIKNSTVTAHGNFSSFPITLIPTLIDDAEWIPSLFGKYVDSQFNIVYTPTANPKALIDLKLKGQDVEADLSVSLDGTLRVSQTKPSFLRWQMTPARYQSLMRLLRPEQEPTFVLTRGASIDLNITELICPSNPPATIKQFICQSGFIGDLKVGPLHFKNRKGAGEIALLNVMASLEGQRLADGIRFRSSGQFVSPSIPNEETAGFSFAGALTGFWTPEGVFNKNGTVKGDLSLDLVPVKEFTGILPLDEENQRQVQALLGPFVNARIYGEISQMTGSLAVDLKSSNLKVILPLNLANGQITLQKTVEAQLTLTPEISETFLKDINPLLITGAYSEHPLKVYIDAEGFVLPFHPFSFRGIHINRAVIDLGNLKVQNGGQIHSMIEFLKVTDISPEGIMDAWFTPIYISLHDGVATYQRFDALLGTSIHFALWGKIDFNKDKVRMTLGIAPSTLQQRFNISGVSKNDMFQVKMRGSTSNLELDWSSAYTRIGILITKSAGPLGNIFGGILEHILGDLGEEDTPPPTTYPFPWDRR